MFAMGTLQAPPFRPFGPPLPLPGGEEKPAATPALFQLEFLSPGQGERWPEGTEWGWLIATHEKWSRA
jgi:hypothetical protein